MVSNRAAIRTLWQTWKSPKLPKLNTYKIAALTLGSIVWILLGYVLRYHYQPLIAFIIGWAISFLPLIIFRVLAYLYYKLFDAKKVGLVIVLGASSTPLAILLIQIEAAYLNGLLTVLPISVAGQHLLSSVIGVVTTLLMPWLWVFGRMKEPPATA